MKETAYGAFPGGDPREFHPDEECCTPAELAAHAAACAAADRGDAGSTELPGSHFWTALPGGAVAHVAAGTLGVGTYTIEIDEDEEEEV